MHVAPAHGFLTGPEARRVRADGNRSDLIPLGRRYPHLVKTQQKDLVDNQIVKSPCSDEISLLLHKIPQKKAACCKRMNSNCLSFWKNHLSGKRMLMLNYFCVIMKHTKIQVLKTLRRLSQSLPGQNEGEHLSSALLIQLLALNHAQYP